MKEWFSVLNMLKIKSLDCDCVFILMFSLTKLSKYNAYYIIVDVDTVTEVVCVCACVNHGPMSQQLLHFVNQFACLLQINDVQMVDGDMPVKFSSEIVFYVDKYEIV